MQEKELLQKLRDKECKNEAFRHLVGRYKERLYRFIRKMIVDHQDTDEVLQLTFIKVFKYIDGFKGNSKLYTWLFTIARNEALSFLEKKSKRTHMPIDMLHQKGMLRLSANTDTYSGNEIQLKLQTAVSRLPEKQREVFNMKYFDKLRYSEIAEITGTSEGGLKANYHLAVKRLKQSLQET
ncbi:RNA polymerase sigma factor [Maribacter sp. 2-571]|uniref:RNA polymerase sigma factor n=1 Tax=Maribacter sp. 2-571 TaxID=3417569 RepID=UPI003D345EFF